MRADPSSGQLTVSLEDYLETIYEIVRDQKVARVKDIAKARGVKAASVTPAMRRLAELGLVQYSQREYIDLTKQGEAQARRIYARHQVLTRFFEQVLRLDPDAAQQNACSMEHSLSDQGMDHLVRLFEFLGNCQEGRELLAKFHQCSMVHDDVRPCPVACQSTGRSARQTLAESTTLAQIKPGARAKVAQVNGIGPLRQRLLDMGILPETVIEVERVAPGGGPVWIKVQGFQLSLRRKEAESVIVGAL